MRLETWCALIKERGSWLRVEQIDRGRGAFDIALVIDGTYVDELAPMLDWWQEQLAEARREVSSIVGSDTFGSGVLPPPDTPLPRTPCRQRVDSGSHPASAPSPTVSTPQEAP